MPEDRSVPLVLTVLLHNALASTHNACRIPNALLQVTGTLRGFDHFMNLVLDDAVEDVSATEKRPIGKIVRLASSQD